MSFGNKREALLHVLDECGIRYRPDAAAWQAVRCPDTSAHTHGDRNPSASIHVRAGRFHCHACGLSGDGYDLLQKLMNIRAVDFDGPEPVKAEESTWI